jgi:PAS domain S-box-containing protein
LHFPVGTTRVWLHTIAAAGSIAVAYFLAARLGLALLASPSDVAVFWPASGLAAGLLITLGRRARPAVVIGVVAGTIAANLMSDRSVATSIFKGFCNAGESLLMAWLLETWFGQHFTFGDLKRVGGFMAATGLAAAASAVGGAATMTSLHTATPFFDVWRVWFLSDAVGIAVVAPLMIGVAWMWRDPPSRGELLEGAGGLVLLVLIAMHVESHPTESWISFSPSTLVLPLLLWLAARCPPTFAVAGAFVVSILVICATIYGIGRFGDAAAPLTQRVQGAQAAVTTWTLFTLVLVALFEERKNAEKALRASEKRLAKKSAALTRLHDAGARLWLKRDLDEALDGILLGSLELLDADMGHIQVVDPRRGVIRIAAHHGCDQAFINHLGEVAGANDSVSATALQAQERVVIEDVEEDALFAPFLPLARAGDWRALQATPIMSRAGAPLGILSTHFRSVHKLTEDDLRLLDLYVRLAGDIIEHHEADNALRESEERLRLAQLKTGIGVWDWKLRTGELTWTPQLEALFGLEPGSVKRYADFRDRVHPDDLAALEAARNTAIRRRETYNVEFRIIRPDGQLRWISTVGGAVYDEASGEPVRLLGNNIDITERKLAEQSLAERNAQLELASEAVQVGSYTYDNVAGIMNLSPACASIYGLPGNTAQITRDAWRALVHPEDLTRLNVERRQAFKKRKRDLVGEFRIIRADNAEVRWIEVRTLTVYNQVGRPSRMTGVAIDVTERKRAERALAERNTQLHLATRIARVGTFTVDYAGGVVQLSPGCATLYGLPEETVEIPRDRARALVHPEDLPRVDARRTEILRQRRRELVAQFRIMRQADSKVRWIEARSLISYDEGGAPINMVGAAIDVTEQRQIEDHQKLLIAELDHRVKNTLASVQAIVKQTSECSASLGTFVEMLNGRVQSLANTHALLSRSRWHGVSLGELLRAELSPCMTADNTRIEGPEIFLIAEAAQPVAMVVHELATNAAKYGALSNTYGQVSVHWRWQPNGAAERGLALEWREMGVAVRAPAASGYGTSVIRDLIPYELGGSVEYVLAPDGVRCTLEIPARWLSSGTQ